MTWNLATLCLFGLMIAGGLEAYSADEEYLQMKAEGKLRKGCSNGFPTGSIPPARIRTTLRLEVLRKQMSEETSTRKITPDAYIITSNDEHLTEFVAEYDRRREFISGFSGSYGDVVVTQKDAVLWTDGRYHLQADDQLDCNWSLMREGHRNVPTLAEWLINKFPNGGKIGTDPKLISASYWEELKYQFSQAANPLQLVAIENNLIDEIWTRGRYAKRSKDAFILGEKYSGMNWTSKIDETRKKLFKAGADALVVTALDEVAWLLNIRGRDIPFNPFVKSYVILDRFEIRLFVNSSQLEQNNIFKYFNKTHTEQKHTISIKNYTTICRELRDLTQSYKKILVPRRFSASQGVSHYIRECIPEEKRLSRPSPIIFLKARKNPTEIEGMRNAHIRDAAAMCDFFSYLESKFKAGTIFTELDVVRILNDIRFEQEDSLGNSFRTIAAFGPNGAQPHYEPTPNTNVNITHESTLVLDSGGQYYDGTTDVTRTVHLGNPTDEQREAYTRVLIGLIQLSSLTFPADMTSAVADVLARAPLWEIGLDYLHQTSHGIGSFLGVHESPISVHYREAGFTQSSLLKVGYFLSIEPGFYQKEDFGIRLENIVQVIEKPWLEPIDDYTPFLGFRTATLVPFDMKLVDLRLLSVHHRRWLNEYNKNIRTLVGAELKKQNLMKGFYWMMDKTSSIPEYGHSNKIQAQSLFIILINALLVGIASIQ